MDKTPMERATLLEGFNEFKEEHRSYAAMGQSNLASAERDVKHHFIAFITTPTGQLLELDGTRSGGPRVLLPEGCCTDVLRGTPSKKIITHSIYLLSSSNFYHRFIFCFRFSRYNPISII